MKNEIAKQVCSNCKYFKRHYVVTDNNTLIATNSGHCVHLKIKDSVSARHVQKNEGCELWQPYELQKIKRQYRIEQNLQDISDRVGEILTILRDVD